MEDATGGPGSAAIWTPDRRLRVFVSSTLGELAPERVAARSAIEAMHLTPVLFELGARPHPPRALYVAYMEQSDVFIGIYWQRYGWVAPGATISGLEDEFELSSRLPRLLYVKEPAPDREPGLAALLDRFETEGSVSYRRFSDPEELARLIADDLAVLLSERFGAAASGSAPAVSLRRPMLPVPLTPTIGRRRETSAVAGLLRDGARLVTVTGTGGVGKTRLALTVAADVGTERQGAVHFVPLTSVADPRQVVATIAEHVGARLDTTAPLDALADHLCGRHALLVLDNFEHVAQAAADLSALIDRCPDLQMLVTSRHVLRLRCEHEFPLAPLDVPAPSATDVAGASAVELFVERAAAARPGFALTPGNEQDVAELCRRLDGLPLALELAAARLRLLEPDELLERLGSRLDLLASGAADLPERQRALRATLDWSYNLLTPAEQTLFGRLSVFAGGATLRAAEAVCGDDELPDVLEVMASLLEKSLLVHVTTDGAPGRFQMLHVVRAYAWERLAGRGETDLLRARHADWFIDVLRSRKQGGSDEERWAVLDAENDNFRAVLAWAFEQDDLAAVSTLVRGLKAWWWVRGQVPEALEWLERAAALGRRLAPDSVEAAWILLALAHIREQAGLLDGTEELLRAALDTFTAHDERNGVVAATLALASVLADQGELHEAVGLAEETLDQACRDHLDDVVEWASSILGTFLTAAGELDGARVAHERARDAAARMGADVYLAMAHHQLALVELMARRLDACWDHLGASAAIYERAPHLDGVSYALEIAAAACLVGHDVGEAADAAALSQEIHEALRLPVWPVLRPLHEQLMAALRKATAGPLPAPAPAGRADPAAYLRALCARHQA